MEGLRQALIGLEDYDLLGPLAVVECLQRLEQIAQAAAAADLSWESLQVAASQVMDQHWSADGLPEALLAPRRAEVLLRLDTMLEKIQAQRREEPCFSWRSRGDRPNEWDRYFVHLPKEE